MFSSFLYTACGTVHVCVSSYGDLTFEAAAAVGIKRLFVFFLERQGILLVREHANILTQLRRSFTLLPPHTRLQGALMTGGSKRTRVGTLHAVKCQSNVWHQRQAREEAKKKEIKRSVTAG